MSPFTMPPMPPAVIEVVGSLNMDLVSVTPRVPGPGETLAARSFSTGFGGKGANQSVACARSLRKDATQPPDDGRVQVHHVGAVGSDQFGRDFLDHLRNEHVSTDKIIVKEGYTTGTAVILVEEATGENRILISAGANGQVRPEDVQLSVPSPDERHVVIYQLEIPLETVVASIKAAKALGKTVILNPAPAVALDDDLYPYIDHLVLNESEASLLSGFPEDTLADSLNKVAKIFCDKGVDVVIITLGRAGVFVRTAEEAKDNIPGMRVRGEKVEVVDTTAAGDTFVGVYASVLAVNGLDLIELAVKLANHAAAKTVGKPGAQSSMPFFGEIRPAVVRDVR